MFPQWVLGILPFIGCDWWCGDQSLPCKEWGRLFALCLALPSLGQGLLCGCSSRSPQIRLSCCGRLVGLEPFHGGRVGHTWVFLSRSHPWQCILWCRLAPIVPAQKLHCCWHSLGPASTAGSAGSQPSCARSWAHKATSADPLKSRTWTLVPPRPRMLAKLGATECWAPWPQAPTVICWDALQELSLQSSHNT